MARKLSKLLNIVDYVMSCKNKVKYGHKETADRAIKSMRKKGAKGLEAYQCRFGSHWHIGHSH